MNLLPEFSAVRPGSVVSRGPSIAPGRKHKKASSKIMFVRIDEIFTCTKKVDCYPMLVMLPGLICDASIYAPQTAAFPESEAVEGYGVLSSLRGMAQSVL